MWLLLAFDIVCFLIAFYAAGFFISKSLGISFLESICTAPLFSITILFVSAYVLALLGISVDGSVLFIWLLSLGVIACIATFLRYRAGGNAVCIRVALRDKLRDPQLRILVFSVLLACAVCIYAYVLPLDSAISFFQGFDSYYHVNQVREYINTGFFASLPITVYPNLWHSMAAIVGCLGGQQVTVAVNALNIVLTAFVAPTSVFCFMRTIFNSQGNKANRYLFCSMFVVATSSAFPWTYVANGPYYALLIGWAILPVAMVYYLKMIQGRFLSFSQLRDALLFLIFTFACAVGHPSVIFAAVAFLTPATVWVIWRRGKTNLKKIFGSAVFVLFVCAAWYLCFISPMFSGVVNFPRGAVTSLFEAFSDAFVFAVMPSMAPQLFLAFFTFLGIIYAWTHKQYRWLIFSFVLTGLMYCVSTGTSGYLMHLVSGFWYADQNRMGAIYGFAAIPLAAIGLRIAIVGIARIAKIIALSMKNHFDFACALVVVPYLIFSLAPSFSNGAGSRFETGFGFTRERLAEFNNLGADAFCYDLDEIHFMNEVKAVVGDSKVLNYAYDGSCYAYAVNNVDTVNRDWWMTDSDVNDPMVLLRARINEVGSNESVRDACADNGIKYIVLLDYGHLFGDGVFNYEHRLPELWEGLTSITDSTPGLKLLLSKEDMRLYQIEGIE